MYNYVNYYEQYLPIIENAKKAADNVVSHPVSSNISSQIDNAIVNIESTTKILSSNNNDSVVISFRDSLSSHLNTIKSIKDFLTGDYVNVEKTYQNLKYYLERLQSLNGILKILCIDKPKQSDYTIDGVEDEERYRKKLRQWQLKVFSLKGDCKKIQIRVNEYLKYLDSINACVPSEGKSNISAPSFDLIPITFTTVNSAFDFLNNFSSNSSNIEIPVKIKNGADPWVMYKDGYYYYTDTDVSSNAQYIKIYKSKNLFDVDNSEVVFQYYQKSGGIWAPEIHYIGDKWYIYYTYVDTSQSSANDKNRRMFVMQSNSSDISSGFSQPKMIEAPGSEGSYAIDGTPLEWNGELYMVWSGREKNSNNDQSLYIAHMSDPTTIDGERHQISVPEYNWEKGTNGHDVNEGPQVLIKDNSLHVIYSASPAYQDNYCLGMLTYDGSGDIEDMSSWKKTEQPVFKTGTSAIAPGHCSFVQSPDGKEDWIVYHARDKKSQNWNKRNIRMQKFDWNGTDPVFGEPLSIDDSQVAPSGTKPPTEPSV